MTNNHSTHLDLTPAELAAIRARGVSGGALVWADAQPLIVAHERLNRIVPGRGGIVARVEKLLRELNAAAPSGGGTPQRAGAERSGLFG